ncbi:MAG: UTP--glucose-1-phosphate uridylyltransferase [Myxococcota bacterium]
MPITPARVRKAILPVAGLGTRLLPVTKAVPKEMLPIVDKPCVHYVVEEALSAGIEEVALVTARGKGDIEDFFDRDTDLEHLLAEGGKRKQLNALRSVPQAASICAIRQPSPQGLGHAVACAKRFAAGEPVAVLLSDDLVRVKDGRRSAVGQLIDAFERTGAAQVGLINIPPEEMHCYGVARGQTDATGAFVIEKTIEKPAAGAVPPSPAIMGRYILPPTIWPFLRAQGPGKNGEIQLTDALNHFAHTHPLHGCFIKGQRIDVGSPLGYVQATVLETLSRPQLRQDFVTWLKQQQVIH